MFGFVKKNSFATVGEKKKIRARDEKAILIRRRSCSSVIFKGKSYSSVVDLRIRLGSLLFSSPSMLPGFQLLWGSFGL